MSKQYRQEAIRKELVEATIWIAVGLLLLSGLLVRLRAQSYQPIVLQLNTVRQQQLYYLLEQTDFNIKTTRELSKIIQAESSWNENAYNAKTHDSGFFQINHATWNKKAEQLGFADYETNWKTNIRFGVYIAKVQGASAWSASYKTHKVESITL